MIRITTQLKPPQGIIQENVRRARTGPLGVELTDRCTARHFFLMIWYLYYGDDAVSEYGEMT